MGGCHSGRWAGALKAILKQISRKAREEGQEIRRWTDRKGQEGAARVIEKLLSGEQVEWPNVSVKWVPIAYRARHVAVNAVKTPWVAMNHGAFVLIWKGPGGSRRPHKAPVNVDIPATFLVVH